jgi:hypothetical protein
VAEIDVVRKNVNSRRNLLTRLIDR